MTEVERDSNLLIKARASVKRYAEQPYEVHHPHGSQESKLMPLTRSVLPDYMKELPPPPGEELNRAINRLVALLKAIKDSITADSPPLIPLRTIQVALLAATDGSNAIQPIVRIPHHSRIQLSSNEILVIFHSPLLGLTQHLEESGSIFDALTLSAWCHSGKAINCRDEAREPRPHHSHTVKDIIGPLAAALYTFANYHCDVQTKSPLTWEEVDLLLSGALFYPDLGSYLMSNIYPAIFSKPRRGLVLLDTHLQKSLMTDCIRFLSRSTIYNLMMSCNDPRADWLTLGDQAYDQGIQIPQTGIMINRSGLGMSRWPGRFLLMPGRYSTHIVPYDIANGVTRYFSSGANSRLQIPYPHQPGSLHPDLVRIMEEIADHTDKRYTRPILDHLKLPLTELFPTITNMMNPFPDPDGENVFVEDSAPLAPTKASAGVNSPSITGTPKKKFGYRREGD